MFVTTHTLIHYNFFQVTRVKTQSLIFIWYQSHDKKISDIGHKQGSSQSFHKCTSITKSKCSQIQSMQIVDHKSEISMLAKF